MHVSVDASPYLAALVGANDAVMQRPQDCYLRIGNLGTPAEQPKFVTSQGS